MKLINVLCTFFLFSLFKLITFIVGYLLDMPNMRKMADEDKVLKYGSNEKCQWLECFQEPSLRNIFVYSLCQASTGFDINTIYHCQDFELCKSHSHEPNSIYIASQCEVNPNKHNCSSKTSLYRKKTRHCEVDYLNQKSTKKGLFSYSVTIVYMTLFNEYHCRRTSGSQATASINKCFQVCDGTAESSTRSYSSNSNYYSNSAIITPPYHNNRNNIQGTLLSDIYFFGKSINKQKGMGPKDSNKTLHNSDQSSSGATKTNKVSSGSNTYNQSNIRQNQAASTCNQKSVSIKEENLQKDNSLKPCPALGTCKGEMMMTVSHIKIGPKETCPVFANQPCIGPKCKKASSGEEEGPVKVTTVNNPRRGVFELVIRRLTGAPLAKNELMLEWTPPTSRPLPCTSPCTTVCWPPNPCCPSKCKLVVCRASPCRPKCCKKKPCAQPCRVPCKPCPPSPCCPPARCKSPCSAITCKTPCYSCRSSPCLRLCPVGRRRPRKARSQPKIRSHLKRVSPCRNRSRTCPVVKCRSVPGCCKIPPFCLPKKYCSLIRCKSPKCCKSTCSSCCI